MKKVGRPEVLTHDQQLKVVELFQKGSSVYSIARKFSVARTVIKRVLEKAKEFGLSKIEVIVKGIGSGRDSAIRALMASGIEISAIRDVTGLAHNGCRPRKARRV